MKFEGLAVKTVMHPFPHTISPKHSLKQAIHMMKEHNIRHLPVQDGGDLAGILTERDVDFALRVERKLPEEMLVRDAFTAEPYVVEGEESVARVAGKMAHERLGCALVVQNNQLVGIFTTVDACRTLSELLAGRPEQ